MGAPIFTVGHSTQPVETLLGLLGRHGVTAVADVRSRPYSRMNPQFNREALEGRLKASGVAYVFLGRELGARSEDPGCYIDGKVQYDLLARTSLFRDGITRLVKGAGRYRIAIMCAEKDPLTCHRTILVCRHLVAEGLEVQHILEGGHLEAHSAALSRLRRELGLPASDLFRTQDELEREAYARRGDQIAWVERRPEDDADTQENAR